MTGQPPTLLAVAHGTTNPDGLAEIRRLVNIVRTKRPDVPIELCWLERADPSFEVALAENDGPVVVVPVLLSTGYHVKTDITAVVGDRRDTVITAQLGPDRRITKVAHDRLLAQQPVNDLEDVVLFASGSSDPEAAENLAVVAGQLERALRSPVLPRFLTDDGWWRGVRGRSRVANYLLAPGRFNDLLHEYAEERLDSDCVAAPIGAHPAVAAVISDRYDAGVRALALR